MICLSGKRSRLGGEIEVGYRVIVRDCIIVSTWSIREILESHPDDDGFQNHSIAYRLILEFGSGFVLNRSGYKSKGKAFWLHQLYS